MPTHSNNLDRCSFIGHKGLCGRRCFRDVCSIHYEKTPMKLCKNCGVKGTSTPHGYCAAVDTGCIWKAHHASRVLKGKRDDMDEFIEEVLSWNWESYTHPPPVSPHSAVPEAAVKPLTVTLTRLLKQNAHAIGLQRALSEAIQAALAEDNFES